MCKRSICLASFAFVLSAVLSSAANAADPSLVGWWRLDETSGTTARDSSGNGNDGTLHGNPQWDAGMIGGALHLDDASLDYVEIPFSEHLRVLNQSDFTHTAWVNFDEVNRKQQIIMQGDSGGLGRPSFFITGSGAVQSWLGAAGTYAGVNLEAGQWYHLAVVVTENGPIDSVQLHVNGVAAGNAGQMGMESCEGAYLIGRHKANQAEFMDGLVDEVRMYNRALTEAELHDVMLGVGMTPALASEPYPADGATDVPSDVVLIWKPGEYAPTVNGHKVYLSKSLDDVSDGIGGVTLDNSSYAPPQRLDFGMTYYWRVDEANSVSGWNQGRVWQFAVEPFVYPIAGQNIAATASSSFNAATGPGNTINGSGLDADGLHSEEQTDMWLSTPTGAQPTWIQYEFDEIYKLHEMWIWNYNQMIESIVGFGIKDVTIEYSADGIDWAQLADVPEFAQAPGTPGYAHNTTVDLRGVAAKYVRITADSNRGFLAQYGLSEVRFFYIPIHAREPVPADGATGVSIGTIDDPLDVTLGFRAGREAAKHNVYLST
ncbi:MAG TPA: LamG-like jellyroll fold domain-containing protein, partial [Sedimentisphaerales bacterium]|nr:LamG-like jellyroll fold domain-containing protein [Sedimentisphaerales bacterium]